MIESAGIHKEGQLGAATIGKESHIEGAMINERASNYHANTSADAQKFAARLADHARTEAAAGRLAGTQLNALLHASDNLAQLPAKLERGRAGDKEYATAVRAESMLKIQLDADPSNKELQTSFFKAQDKLNEYRKSDAETIARAQSQVDALAKKAFGSDFTSFTPTSAPKIIDPFAKPK
jgi:hypothetical protein